MKVRLMFLLSDNSAAQLQCPFRADSDIAT